MNIQEVIEAVKAQISYIELVKRNSGHRDDDNKAIEGNKIILAALEKQIPKKPKHEPTKLTDWSCPECGQTQDSKYPYCSFCGQAIDWSNDEN